MDEPSSFRDPSGKIFYDKARVYRAIFPNYVDNFNSLMSSGLYARLIEEGLLIPHRDSRKRYPGAAKVIAPQPVPFISYPYEWCFSQLKDAALATLKIQKIALDHGMVLKDGSAYNIQFVKNKPVLIDTLSFEKRGGDRPWVAYQQFTRHFLAPLALMAKTDVRLSQLLASNIDGVPLDLASKLLPHRSKLNPGLLTHIHLHSSFQKRHEKPKKTKVKPMSKASLYGLVDNLASTVASLKLKGIETEWGSYYRDTNYSTAAMHDKKRIIEEIAKKTAAEKVLDLGSNTGVFSKLFSKRNISVLSLDVDPLAVEKNYQRCKSEGDEHTFPALYDISNPSPAIGFRNMERPALFDRFKPDMVLALALIHHLRITHNIPLADMADYFRSVSPDQVVEWVPKDDSQVRRMLYSRQDVFDDYDVKCFEKEFKKGAVMKKHKLKQSGRVIYHFRSK